MTDPVARDRLAALLDNHWLVNEVVASCSCGAWEWNPRDDTHTVLELGEHFYPFTEHIADRLLAAGVLPPDTHVHEWEDAPDDETGWYCPGCGSTEYPGMIDELTPREAALDVVPPPAAPGLDALVESWEASARQIDERTFLGDPAANIATANTLRSCANRLRAALAEAPGEPR